MMSDLQKAVIDQNSRSPSSREKGKIRCGMTVDEEALQQQLAISNNVEKALINLVPGYNNNTFPTLRGRRALVLINGTPQNETLYMDSSQLQTFFC